MNTISNIIIIAAIITICIIIYIYVRDYLQYKSLVNTQLSVAQSAVNSEKADRVGNLKYIVDQQNNVNSQIYSTTQQNLANQSTLSSQLDASQGNILAGLNSAMNFTDNHGNNVPIINLPGAANPNMNLMNNVNATMGLTAKDFNTNGQVKMCNASGTKCIKFPDQNGDTYLTDIGTGGSIILNGTNGTQINNGVNLNGSLNINSSSGAPSGTIVPGSGSNQMLLQTNMVGVGNFPSSIAPEATLHVNSPNGTDTLLKLSTDQGDQVITVTPDGQLSIYLNGALAGRIIPTSNGLTIAANVVLDGNLNVGTGNTITGNVVPPPPLQLQAGAPPPAKIVYVTVPASCGNPPASGAPSYSPAPSSGSAYSPAPSSGSAYSSAPSDNSAYSPAPSDNSAYSPAPSSRSAYSPAPSDNSAYSPAPSGGSAYSSAPSGGSSYTSAPSGGSSYTSAPSGGSAYTSALLGGSVAYNQPYQMPNQQTTNPVDVNSSNPFLNGQCKARISAAATAARKALVH